MLGVKLVYTYDYSAIVNNLPSRTSLMKPVSRIEFTIGMTKKPSVIIFQKYPSK